MLEVFFWGTAIIYMPAIFVQTFNGQKGQSFWETFQLLVSERQARGRRTLGNAG